MYPRLNFTMETTHHLEFSKTKLMILFLITISMVYNYLFK